jgi:hypothetical protein
LLYIWGCPKIPPDAGTEWTTRERSGEHNLGSPPPGSVGAKSSAQGLQQCGALAKGFDDFRVALKLDFASLLSPGRGGGFRTLSSGGVEVDLLFFLGGLY